MGDPLSSIHIFNAKAIAAGGDATYTQNLERFNSQGFFSLQLHVTGSGIITAEFLLSLNNADFLGGFTEIVTGFDATSGPNSDGKNIFSFEPILASHMQIKITETGTTDPVAVSAWLGIQ